jgi:extradiol dioxygenase family protein
MQSRYIFHLSFPVLDLARAKDFYLNTLGAKLGRESDQWLDILIWGHQITLQNLPQEVLDENKQGKRHFGVILPWDEFNQLAQSLKDRDIRFYQQPVVINEGRADEQIKMFLRDPSFNVIEIKAYRDFDATLNQHPGGYNYPGAA